MKIFTSLNRQQREAVGLLQIGTFLEYFDLMLYVHMAVLLNELFFPKTDPHTAALLSAFAICSTWLLRPLGALLFGWIGDNIGRKPTVVITTSMMAISCIIIASLPTYAEIGIKAAWIITICRLLQGISSMCEIIGGEVYLTETIQSPLKNTVVASLRVVVELGVVAALIVASLVTSSGMNWRIGFWIGASIAVVGSIARIRLRESPKFIEAKNSSQDKTRKEKLNWSTASAYFFTQAATPFGFVLSYIFCGDLLKTKFGYTSGQVISQNLIVAITALTVVFSCTMASKYISSLKILKFKTIMNFVVSVFTPFLLMYAEPPKQLLFLQCIFIATTLTGVPGQAIFMKALPILKRMSYASLIHAIARALVFALSSFGTIYLVKWFGYCGLWVISLPVCVAFMWGIQYFQKLELEDALKITQTPKSSETRPIAAV